MGSFAIEPGNVLYLVVCACEPALRTIERIRAEQAAGFDVCPVLTPQAAKWIDADEIEKAAGHPVQCEMRTWPEPIFQPLGNRILAAPITFNTLNKVGAGMADNMATGLLCEAIGNPAVPVEMEPNVSPEFGRHPAFVENVRRLQDSGVVFRWPTSTIETPDARR